MSILALLLTVNQVGLGRGPALAEDRSVPQANDASSAAAVPLSAPVEPIWLPQTRTDWDALVARIPPDTMFLGRTGDGSLEEVTVLAPTELVPMQDVYSEMWGGILAPFWALRHPTQAWRIFLPIPPE